MRIRLRLLEKRDIEACANIVGLNYSEKYRKSSKREIASMFSNSAVNPTYWLAEADGNIVGFAGYIQSWMDYGVYQIFWVNVKPQFQGLRIGNRLVSKLISEIRKKRGACLIQLTATLNNTVYYRRYFRFVTLTRINPDEDLMSLAL